MDKQSSKTKNNSFTVQEILAALKQAAASGVLNLKNIISTLKDQEAFSKISSEDIKELVNNTIEKEKQKTKVEQIVKNQQEQERAKAELEKVVLEKQDAEQERNFKQFKELTNDYIKDKEQENKKIENILSDLNKGHFNERDFESLIMNEREIKEEQERRQNIMSLHQGIKDHHKDLHHRLNELTTEHNHSDTHPHRRNAIGSLIKDYQEAIEKHKPRVEEAEKQVNKIQQVDKRKEEGCKKLQEHAEKHQDEKVKKFADLAKKQHEAVKTGKPMSINPEKEVGARRKKFADLAEETFKPVNTEKPINKNVDPREIAKEMQSKLSVHKGKNILPDNNYSSAIFIKKAPEGMTR